MASIEGPLKQVLFVHMDAPNEPIADGFAVCDGSTLSSSQQDINPGGTYVLPDYRNVFFLGADPTKSVAQAAVAVGNANINLAAGAPGPKGTGGGNQYTLASGEMPSHTHSGTPGGSTTVSFTDPGHTHVVTDPGHGHTLTDPGHNHIGSTSTQADHNHGVTDPGHVHTYPGSRNMVTFTGFGAPGGYENGSTPISPAENSATTGISINPAGSHAHTVSINSATTGLTIANRVTGITIASATSGMTGTISGLTLSIANTGGGGAFDNRPRYVGIVPIMRVKL